MKFTKPASQTKEFRPAPDLVPDVFYTISYAILGLPSAI